MKRSPAVEQVHRVLKDPDRGFIDYILSTVNLTLLEKEIITRSEIDNTDLETICNTLQNWNNPKRACSYVHAVKTKRQGMIKIYNFLQILKYQ